MDSSANESKSNETESVPPPPALLVYACQPWRFSSQRVSDLYESGVKLWTKADLEDIERQLEKFTEVDRFTVRGVDGRIVQIKNPLIGANKPIWKPFVSYREYWKLVLGGSDEEGDALYCSYLIDWRHQLARDFRGNIEDWQKLFEAKRQMWNASITCASFKQRLSEVVAAHKVTKVICFALGDMARQPPEVHIGPGQAYEAESHGAEIHQEMIQHAAALTMAEEVRRACPGAVRLLAQDPQYSDDTQDFLKMKGFEIVGNYGGEGFAHVDNESIIFAAWPSAPVKQIIADIARPVAFITLSDGTFNRFNKPYSDAESPRTRQMWLGYEKSGFPTSSVEVESMKGLHGLDIFVRKGKQKSPQYHPE